MFGMHLMLDGRNCDKKKLTDMRFVKKFLKELPPLIGMHVISKPLVMRYKDKWASTPGITGLIVLAESHVSVHTFPDNNYIFVDLFSCNEFDAEKARKHIIKQFKIKDVIYYKVIKRGKGFVK